MEWYVKVLQNYVGFTGRARRSEYWWFALINAVVAVALTVLEAIVLGTQVMSGLYTLAVLVPGLAVSIRRLHDTGRSGWWLLIALVPLVGGIVLLVFLLLDSEPGVNRWGPSPKQIGAVAPPPAIA